MSGMSAYDWALRILLIIWLRVFREFHFVLVPMASSRLDSYPQSRLGILLSLRDRAQLLSKKGRVSVSADAQERNGSKFGNSE